MAGPKHPRRYDEAFKRRIVQSYENGKPPSQIRAGYDIARSAPRRWVQGIRDSGSTRAADNRTSGWNELIEPRKRNRRLEMEVDVSVYFVKLRWTCSALNLDTVGVQLEHRRRLVPCFVVCLVYFMRECLFR